jgi:threonyl-tRNA synthetase
MKVPTILVVGKKEAEQKTVALRRLDGEAQEILPLKEAVKLLSTEGTPPDLKEQPSS